MSLVCASSGAVQEKALYYVQSGTCANKTIEPCDRKCAVLCLEQDLSVRNCNRTGADMGMRVLCTKRDLSSETEIAAGSVRCRLMLFGARSGT